MYRLHIDIPLDCDLESAKQIGLAVVNSILADQAHSHSEKVIPSLAPITTDDTIDPESPTYKVTQLNYRLGNDEDRQKSNYYIMDSRGHVTHKKCVIDFSSDGVLQPRTV
jgi:hypothetical protein